MGGSGRRYVENLSNVKPSPLWQRFTPISSSSCETTKPKQGQISGREQVQHLALLHHLHALMTSSDWGALSQWHWGLISPNHKWMTAAPAGVSVHTHITVLSFMLGNITSDEVSSRRLQRQDIFLWRSDYLSIDLGSALLFLPYHATAVTSLLKRVNHHSFSPSRPVFLPLPVRRGFGMSWRSLLKKIHRPCPILLFFL